MPTKKTAAKKSVAKKAAPRKTAAKKVVLQPAPAPPGPVVATADPSGLQPDESKSVDSVAQEILAGARRWSSGREREILVKKAGFDPEEVRKAVNRARAQRRRDEQR